MESDPWDVSMRSSRGQEMLVYYAGPLFSAAERRFNDDLAQKIEALGFEVFLPQRDGVESSKPPYDAMTREERRRALYELDKSMVQKADLFLFVLDGRVPDEGACVELGIAACHKELAHPEKLLVGLHTDARAAFMGARLNPMVRMPFDAQAESEDELLRLLQEFLRSSGQE